MQRVKKGSDQMSEKEKEILKSIDKYISKLSDFDKGYILGMAESRAEEKRKSRSDLERASKEEI